MWNSNLQPELKISESAGAGIVLQTDGFSFAYLKELFLSSMMQWMSVGSGSESAGGEAGSGKSMDEIVLQQAGQLKAQMSGSATSTKAARA